MNVLFTTIGGSPAPIITHIRRNRPDFIYFIVSNSVDGNESSRPVVDGEYEFQGEKQVNIVDATGIGANIYEIIEVEVDRPFNLYETLYPVIMKHVEAKDNVIVDYTGGTKSMSAGLFSAAAEFPEVSFVITTGRRQNLIKVEDGMERLKNLPKNKIYIDRQLKISNGLIRERNYHAAFQTLVNLSNEMYVDKENFDDIYYLTLGFDRWDKFEYEKAAQYLNSVRHIEQIKSYSSTVNRLVSIVNWAEGWEVGTRGNPTHDGYILVYDLLRNAERKAHLGLYDDAVARVYRALEMYEQLCLMTTKPGFKTSSIHIDELPESIRSDYKTQKQPMKISLVAGYNLLAKLNHPVGQVWEKNSKKLLNVLSIRNNSYLAHGFNPVTKSEFEEMKQVVWSFIEACDQAMKFRNNLIAYRQLPDHFDV